MWTGFSTFPMIFVNGTWNGGNSDMEAEKANGTLSSRL
jgi:glutaredoxin